MEFEPKPGEITVSQTGEISSNIEPSPLDIFQQNRGLFFVSTHKFYKFPIDSNYKKFQESKYKLIGSFDEVLHHYQDDETSDEESTKELLVTLIEEDEEHRVHYFKYIVGDDEAFEPATRERIHEFLDEAEEQNDEKHEFVSVYASYLEADCNKLEEVLSNSTRVKIIEAINRTSEHALFIGQIAAGIALGSVVAHRIKKSLDKPGE